MTEEKLWSKPWKDFFGAGSETDLFSCWKGVFWVWLKKLAVGGFSISHSDIFTNYKIH
jgi:hypothetical protein